jgi:DNA polymerase III delta prime subunit
MKEMHHANVIVGGENNRHFVFEILERDLEFKTQANPDFLLLEIESFGIDDARELERWATGTPFLGGLKVSVMIIKSITFEAQNALLKVLEEPPLGTYIFINIESLGGLLPTFLSRVRVLDAPEEDTKENIPKDNTYKFLNSKIKEKLSLIQSLSKKNPSADGKSEMKELIKNLEEVAYKNNFKSQDLKSILTAKILASARGSSPKMLLEWLSCVLYN